MGLEKHEVAYAISKIAELLGDAMKPDSPGGESINMSEIWTIVSDVGIQVVNDIGDTDYPVEEAPE